MAAPCIGVLLVFFGGCQAHEPSFDDDIAPILEQRCAATACHGVAKGAEAAGEVIDWSLFMLRVDADGRLTDLAAARKATLRARGEAEDPVFSPLLRKPLPAAFGGLPHHGRDNFTSDRDPAYQILARWLRDQPAPSPPPPPSPAEQAFITHAQPALDAAMCSNANCHGVTAAIPFRLEPGIDGKRSRQLLHHNYEVARTMIHLDGWPRRSRLLAKSLPPGKGGIAHKGGRHGLLKGWSDPRAEALLRWICAEQLERTGVACGPLDEPRPDAGTVEILAVRGKLAARRAFDLDAFVPGTQVVRIALKGPDLQGGIAAELTPKGADSRDPAVSADARWAAFARRDDAEHGHAIWKVELGTGAPVQLTKPGTRDAHGRLRTDRDPTFGPDGRIWFVSTRDAQRADNGRLDAELYVMQPDGKDVQRRTFTPHIERKPIFFRTGEENGGEIAFGALRDVFSVGARAHPFRFPPNMKTEYHQHFGITPPEDLFWDTRELPDGRYVCIVGDLRGRWRAGQPAVFDRNFGPELLPGTPPSAAGLPGYAAPLHRLDPKAAAAGRSGRLWRDLAPLPDGRILAAVAEGSWSLAQADGDVRTHLAWTRVVDGPDAPELAAPVTILVDLGRSLWDPEPIVATFTHASGEGGPKPGDPAFLLHQGMPMIDGVLANLYPAGAKVAHPSMVAVRVVEALRDGPPSTHGERLPAQVLAELPLATDGSFQAQIPAGLAFRLQGLDKQGLAVGVPHNRWFYLEAGQVMRQGVSHLRSADYAGACAGCHGAAQGDANKAFTDVDAVTTASLTLSRYKGGDPRRPITAPSLGDATRIAVDYKAAIGPLLVKRCATAGCHDDGAAAAGLDLSTSNGGLAGARKRLLAKGTGSGHGHRWVDATVGSARRSHLVERVMGVELDAPGRVPKPVAPHPKTDPLTIDERRALARWIDLGAPLDGGGSSK